MEQHDYSVSRENTTMRALVEAIFRYQKRFLVAFAIASAIVVLCFAFVQRQHQSETDLSIRNTRPDQQIITEQANNSFSQDNAREETINFEIKQEHYKHELVSAQQQLASFQKDKQIISVKIKETTLEAQISQLQQQIRTTDVEIRELAERLSSGRRLLSSMDQRLTTQEKTVPNTLTMQQLSIMLTTYRNNKTTLLTKLKPTDRLVQEVDQQMVNTSEALHAASEIQTSEKTTGINPVWLQIKSVMSQNYVDRNAAIVRLRRQNNQLSQLQALLVKTESDAIEFNTLQTKVLELQEKYQFYSHKNTELEASPALNHIAIIQRPTYPAKIFSPKLVVALLLGSFSALLVALCVVLLSELRRDTILYPWELQAITSTPLLATIPFIREDLTFSRMLYSKTEQAITQSSHSNFSSKLTMTSYDLCSLMTTHVTKNERSIARHNKTLELKNNSFLVELSSSSP